MLNCLLHQFITELFPIKILFQNSQGLELSFACEQIALDLGASVASETFRATD